jgi:tetratricopeptide (TPR) repeat protein/predicted Ser/Thr protein kinase
VNEASGKDPAWDEVKELFLEASALPASERPDFLDRRCGTRVDLRREIESLLVSDADAPPFVDRPESALGLAVSAAAEQIVSAREAGHPESIGGCRVRSLVGEGTFGFVYLAEQNSPRRRVAVKVLKPGIVSPSALRRLEREADIMARLQHPGIAQVIEAGVEPGPPPRPYFVMEFIEGVPVSDYVRVHHLTTTDRLRLFMAVCDAVQHAHGNGVIHRDLKPSNILVTRDGHSKVLDFGVARSLDPDARQATLATSVGQLIGTLAYMSPEQAAGDADRVDARADVYGLGAVLYELLSCRVPLEVSDKPLTEALRIIQSQAPPRLSAVSRTFRGDIETIVAKALEKDPARRYATVAEFGADLRRHLEHQTILARRPGPIYELTKFAARHRALVAGALVAVAGLVAGAVAAGVWAVQARRDARTSESVAYVLTDALRAVDAASGGNEYEAITALANATDRVVSSAHDRPALATRVLGEVGTLLAAYTHPAAVETLERAVEASVRAHGESAVETAIARCTLAGALTKYERREEAVALLRPAVALLLADKVSPHEAGVEGLISLAAVLTELGKCDEARECVERARSLVERLGTRQAELRGMARAQSAVVEYLMAPSASEGPLRELEAAASDIADALGPVHPRTLDAKQLHARVLGNVKRHEESVELYAETLRNAEARFGSWNPALAVQRQSLANQLFHLKRYQEAENILRGTVEIFRKAFGGKHTRVGHALFDLAWTFYEQDEFADTQNQLSDLDQLLMESHAIFAATPSLDGKYGPDGWQTLAVQGSLANYYINEASRPADGEPLYAEVMAGWERRGETSHSQYAVAVANRVSARLKMAPPLLDDETERLARLAFDCCRDSNPDALGSAAVNYHVVLMRRRRFELVEPTWREFLRRAADGPTIHGYIAESLVHLGRFDEAHAELLLAAGGDESKVSPGYMGLLQFRSGRHAEAELLLRRAVESAGYNGANAYWFRSALGECLMSFGRYEEAHPHLVMAHAAAQRQFQSNWMVDEADQRLSRFYTMWGKDRAEEEPAIRAKALAELEAAAKPKPPG